MHSPEPLRRRSPQWVRRMDRGALHGLACRLRNNYRDADLTEAQEWLWRACISELEYRNRNQDKWWRRCSCELCVSPWEE